MTREERHIAVLRRLLESMDVYDSIQPTTERKKAIKAAIQALSQEPQCTEHPCLGTLCRYYKEPCTDIVSRDAVLKKIDYEVEHYCKYLKEVDDKRNAQTHVALVSDNIREEVEQLPSVTQKSETVTEFADRCRECGKMRKGHWIHLRGDMYECSECGKIHTSFEIGECDADYCPNCGAKMVEPQESETEQGLSYADQDTLMSAT